MVMYQHSLPRLSGDWMDGFFHRYSYDAENRLTLVETSRDSLVWEKDARYEYYRHGPLARVTLGDQQVQGLDYAYTLQGWLKGINSTGGSDSLDMGEDAFATSLNRYTAKDAIGLTLNYFENDFAAINGMPFPGYSGHMPPGAYRPLYNGNISSSSVYQRKFDYDNSPGLIFYNYKYDQLNRLTGQDAYNGFKVDSNHWNNIALMGERLKERITYDANGNIQKYLRNSIDPNQLRMDSLNYRYYAGTNQLRQITDTVQSNEYNDPEGRIVDIDGQPDSNYMYDAIGNLIKDSTEKITSIKWNVYGKIQEIVKKDGDAITTIKYTYDALGNRISQTVIPPAGGDKVYTWYVRDAQGNIMSTYKAVGNDSDLKALDLKQTEKYLYGSSRLGLITSDDGVNDGPDPMQNYRPQLGYDRGNKQYELTNHLGNVLATVSDRKFAVPSDTSSLIDHYEPHIVTAQDYYPFGMLSRVDLPGSGKSYKFGFNGQEMNNEVKGGLGNSYTAQYWEYDSRIGRRWNLDPKPIVGISDYSTFNNSPIQFDDPDGDCATCPKGVGFGARHSEKDAGGATPLGGFVFAGKDATLNYTNVGDEKNPNWVISSFQNKAGDVYTWNDEKKWYANKNGGEYDQAWYHDITDWGNKQYGKPLSEAAKNAIEGEPLKDTRSAYGQYKSEGGRLGLLGFVATGIDNSISQWGTDLVAGGHRSGQAIIGGWQFSADIALGASLTTTKSIDLLSFRNGYGPLGEQGLKVGNYRIDLLYRNPASGLGHGTLFSLKQLKKGGSMLRWDYGTLHSGGVGWHSTFRFTIRGAQYGSSAQRSWAAPFMFFRYKKP